MRMVTNWKNIRPSAMLVSAISLAGLLCTGCLDRTETIRVHPNGAVDIRAQFESESQDEFKDGDITPEVGSGWDVAENTITTDDGKTKYRLNATQSFGPGEKLPFTFARHGDLNRDLYLQFPTKLVIEQRNDDRYYHFIRTYEPRWYAQVMGKVDVINERVKKIIADAGGGEEKDLPPTVKRRVIELYVQSALARMEAFAREAFIVSNPNSPPDVWLVAHEAITDFRKTADYPQLMTMIDQIQEEKDDRLFQQLEDDFDSAVIDRIQSALRSTGRAGDLSAFLRNYQRNKTEFHITEDLNDDSFTIRIDMPGVIVGSNADERQGNTLVWKFSGKMMHDRRIELLATSRVTGF